MYSIADQASRTNILHLPDEILFDIISLAGRSGIRNIPLVCKHFYRVYCDFTKCKLVVHDIMIKDENLNSMMNSWRRISQFNISYYDEQKFEDISKIKKIVDRFASPQVSTLKFCHANIYFNNFEYILCSTINVVDIIIDEVNITYSNFADFPNITIDLPNLKKLVLKNCSQKSQAVVQCIGKANLLEEFRVVGEHYFDFTSFFEAHKSINRMTMSGKLLQNSNTFNQLQLTHLQIGTNSENILLLRSVITHQQKLKHLNLLFDGELEYYLRDMRKGENINIIYEVFRAICTLKELETLKVRAELVLLNNKIISEMLNLVNLKKLVMVALGYDVKPKHIKDIFRKINALPLPKLDKLRYRSSRIGEEYMFTSRNAS